MFAINDLSLSHELFNFATIILYHNFSSIIINIFNSNPTIRGDQKYIKIQNIDISSDSATPFVPIDNFAALYCTIISEKNGLKRKS